MGKGNKIVVFVILMIVFIFIGALLKDAGSPLGPIIAGLGIGYLILNLFKKNKKDDNDEQKDISLKK